MRRCRSRRAEHAGAAQLAGRPAFGGGVARDARAARGGGPLVHRVAHQRGWLASDPGTGLGTPKVRRALPHVLRPAEIADVLASSEADIAQPPPDRTPAEAAVALRDSAVLELLYATGIRVE